MSTPQSQAVENCWCGRLNPTLAPPIAEPLVVARDGDRSIVMAMGALKQLTTLRLANLVLGEAERPETRIVYVLMGIIGGRLGSLSISTDSLHQARRHAAIIAFLEEVAWGPALRLAYEMDLVFASPQCQIGWLECFGEESREFDCEASIDMVVKLAELRPQVSPVRFSRLAQTAVTGEAAEAIGLVGGLRRNVFELSGIDPQRVTV